jgi:ParB family chromosome partitioning protein
MTSTLDFLNDIDVPQHQITNLPINLIDPDPEQPRMTFHAVDGMVDPEEREALEELASDIASNGQIQPIAVKEKGNGRYQIIAGERRWRAVKLNNSRSVENSETIQAIIRQDLADAKLRLIQLSENLQRRNLTDIEVGTSLKKIFQEYPQLKKQNVAKLINCNKSYISRVLAFVDPEWAHVVETGIIKRASVLEKFKALPESKREELREKSLNEDRPLTSVDIANARKASSGGLVPPMIPELGAQPKQWLRLGISQDLAMTVQNFLDDQPSEEGSYQPGVSRKTIIDHGGEAVIPSDYKSLGASVLAKRELKLTVNQLIALHKKTKIPNAIVSMMLPVEEMRIAIELLGGEVPEDDNLLVMILSKLLVEKQ